MRATADARPTDVRASPARPTTEPPLLTAGPREPIERLFRDLRSRPEGLT